MRRLVGEGEKGGARNGVGMNGEEIDDKERTRSDAERLEENRLGLSDLADRRVGSRGKKHARAAIC